MIQTGFESKVKVQQIINNQLPSFLLEENPKSVDFLKQYYISQEYQGGPVDIAENLDEYLKLDNLTPEVIVDSTYITSGISATDTTISVNSTKGFPQKYGLFKIDNEIVTYTGLTTNTFTGCQRGFSGITSYHDDLNQEELVFSDTTKAEHITNDSVQNLSSLFLKEFYKKLKYTFAPGLEDVEFVETINAGNFIKEAKSFYQAKGTDESFRILFNVLYGETPRVVNLEDFLIKPSASEYVRREIAIAEVISGNPQKLVGQTIVKSTDSGTSASISEIEPFTRDNKQYFKLSLFIGYDELSTIQGTFNITPSTKSLETVAIGASVVSVDSTIGFAKTGMVISGINSITYSNKTINQFLGCTGVDTAISAADNIRSDEIYYGFEDGDVNKRVELRLTGVLSDFVQISDTLQVSENDTISVKNIGELILNPEQNKTYTEIFGNSWIYNTSSTYEIESFGQSLTLTLKSEIDRSSLKKGDRIEILQRGGSDDGKVVYPTSVSNTPYVDQDIPRGQKSVSLSNFSFNPSTGVEYSIRRKINKVSSSTVPVEYGNNVLISDIQNVYTVLDEDYAYVASNSLPSNNNGLSIPYAYQITKNINSASINSLSNLTNKNSVGQYTTLTFGSNVPFITGDRIYYQPNLDALDGLVSGSSYYVEVLTDKKTIKLYNSLVFIGSDSYLTFNVPSSGMDTHKFTLYSHRFNEIGSQKIFKKFDIPANNKVGIREETVPGSTGMLINGVEIVNYKSLDQIYYGPLESVDVMNGGCGYDVINLPSVTVAGSGTTALLQPVISGSVEKVYVDALDYDIEDVESIDVTGGNGTGAVLKPTITKRSREVSFDGRGTGDGGGVSTSISGTSYQITFLSSHNFANGQEIIYDSNSNLGIGVGIGTSTLVNKASYFAKVDNNTTVKLFYSYNNYSLGINTVGFNTVNTTGIHKFKTKNVKKTISEIKVLDGGKGYTNRKLIVKPTGISTVDSAVNFNNHGFIDGDKILYSTDGTQISGLTTSTGITTTANHYQILKIDDNSFKLSDAGVGGTITSNYESRKFVNISSIGSGYQNFAYPGISVVVNYTPVGLGTTQSKKEVVSTPLVRGSIIDTYVYEGGVGYGSSILNLEIKPKITVKTGRDAQLKPVIVNGIFNSVNIQFGGFEYYSIPDLDVVDSSGMGLGAELRPVISNGRITDVKVISTGIGYSASSTSIQVKSSGSNGKFDPNIRQLNVSTIQKFGNEIFEETKNNKLKYCVGGYFDTLRDSFNESASSVSGIIGWAYDGNPIYGPYGHEDVTDTNSNPKRLSSGYGLSTSRIEDRPSGFVDGFFVEDYEYTNSGDLDIHNGRFSITPDFPNGVYAYHATIDFSGNPQFPYFIGNLYRANTIEENKTNNQSFDFNNSNLLRNTFPYKVSDEYADNDFIIETNEITGQRAIIESIDSGSVSGFNIINSGTDYKVDDVLNFDSSGTEGGGLISKVDSLKGSDILNIETSIETYEDAIFSWENENEVKVSILPRHELRNNDDIVISGFSTYLTKLNSSYEIGITSYYSNLLSPIVGTDASPGAATTEIYVTQLPKSVSVGSSIGIGTETLQVLNIFPNLNILRIKRGILGTAHTATSRIDFIPDSFVVSQKIDYFESSVNEKIYFNARESVGVGTTPGTAGICTDAVTFEFGASSITRAVPTQSIYIENHPFVDNQPVNLTVPTSGTLSISTNAVATPFNLPISGLTTTVFVVNKTINSIGIKTGVGTDHNGNQYEEVFFRNTVPQLLNSDEFLLESIFAQKTGKVQRINSVVSVAATHELIAGDVISLDVEPKLAVGIGTSTGVVVKRDSTTESIVINPIKIDPSDIDTTNNRITVASHNLNSGDKVSYAASLPASGLSTSTYYVYRINDDIIKFSESYIDATKNPPTIVSIANTGGATHSISPINPRISSVKTNSLVFDLSDSSLSGYNFKIYYDNEFNNEFVSTGTTTGFTLVGVGTVGVTTNASLTINYNTTSLNKLPERLYYNLEKSGYLSTADTEVKNNSEILFIDSTYTSDYVVSGVSSYTFNIALNNIPEKTSYISTDCSTFEYTTKSKNVKGSIDKVSVISGGSGYKKLPKFVGSNSAEGTGAYLSPTSNTIGNIKQVRILNEGFEYSSDRTLQPNANISPLIALKDSNTIGVVTVTNGGRNYTTPPNIIVVNTDGGEIIDNGILRASLSGNSIISVDVVQGTKGLSETTSKLYAVNNTNGISIQKIAQQSDTKFICQLTTPTLGFSTDVFSAGEKVYIEGIQKVGTAGSGFNSEDYGYNFFTVESYKNSTFIGTITQDEVTINVSALTTNTGIAKTIQDSFGSIIKKGDYPTFVITQVLSHFKEGEKLISNGVERDLIIKSYDPTGYIKVDGSYGLSVGEIITGKETGSIATIDVIEDNTGRFVVKYANKKDIGWDDNTGKLNDDMQVVANNDYYQNLSYTIKSPIEWKDLRTPVNSLVHTSGLKNFADTGITSTATVSIGSSNATTIVRDVLEELRVDTIYDYDNVLDIDVIGSQSKFLKLENKKLTDYTLSKTNIVLKIDNINNLFNDDDGNPSEYIDLYELSPSVSYDSVLVRVTNTVDNSDIQLTDLVIMNDGTNRLLLEKGSLDNAGIALTHTTSDEYGTFSIAEDKYLRFIPEETYSTDYDLKFIKSNFGSASSGIGTTSIGCVDLTSFSGIVTSGGSGITSSIVDVAIGKYRSLHVNAQVLDSSTNALNFVELYVTHDETNTYLAESYFDSTTGSYSGNFIGSFTSSIDSGILYLNYTNDTSHDVKIKSKIVGFAATTLGIGTYRYQSSGQTEGSERTAIYQSDFSETSSASPANVLTLNKNLFNAAKSIVEVGMGVSKSLHEVLMVQDGTDVYVQQSSFLSIGSTLTSASSGSGKNAGLGTFGGYYYGTDLTLKFFPDATMTSDMNIAAFSECLYTTLDQDNIPNDYTYGDSTEILDIKFYNAIGGSRINRLDFPIKTDGTYIFAKSFSPTNSSQLNLSTGVFTIEDHFFRTGETLTYTPESTIIGIGSTAMTDSTGTVLPSTVYAIRVDDDNFKLATSHSNAMAGTNVSFGSSGEGNAHELAMTKTNSKSIITIDNIIQYPLTYTPISYTLSGNAGGSIGKGTTIFALSGISTLSANDILRIDDEYVKVENVGLASTAIGPITGVGASTIVHVERAFAGSDATSHTDTTTARLYKGAFNIIGKNIYFTESPRGNSQITKDSSNLDFPTSDFGGRVFLRENYDTNQVYDDISDQFTGIGRTFTLTVGGANTAGIGSTGGNGIVVINGVFQTPTTINNPENNFDIIDPESNIAGISTLIFSGITSTDGTQYISQSDVNRNQLPRGGVIVSLGSSGGLGYAPLVSSQVRPKVDAYGAVTGIVGIGTTQSALAISTASYTNTTGLLKITTVEPHGLVLGIVNEVTMVGLHFTCRGTFDVSGADYNEVTGDLTLAIGDHNLSVGEGIRLKNNSLVFKCDKDSYGSTHSYPRAGTDPIAGISTPITSIGSTTITISAGIGTISKHTFASAVAGAVGYGTEHSGVTTTIFPDAANDRPFAITGINSTNTFTANVGISTIPHMYVGQGTAFSWYGDLTYGSGYNDAISIGVSIRDVGYAHTFIGAATGAVTGTGGPFTPTDAAYVSDTGILTLTIPSHGRSSGNVQIVQNSLVFTCARDDHQTFHNYPRSTDPAGGSANLPITVIDADTLSVNVGAGSSGNGATITAHPVGVNTHLFVSATTGGVRRLSGTPADLTSLSVTPPYNPSTGLLTIRTGGTHGCTAVTYKNVTGAVYTPLTGIMTVTSSSHGFSNGDYVKIADNSLTFKCDLDGGVSNHSYPRSSDPINNRWIAIANKTTNTFEMQVGITTAGNYAHTWVSAATSAIMKANSWIGIATGSFTMTCAQDSHSTLHTYPRTTDPAHWTDGNVLGVEDVTGNMFTVNVGKSPYGSGGALTFNIGAAGTNYSNPEIYVSEPRYDNLTVEGISRLSVGPTSDTGNNLLVDLAVSAASTTGIASDTFEVSSFDISRNGYSFRQGDIFTPVGLVTHRTLQNAISKYQLTVNEVFEDTFAAWQFGELDYIDSVKNYQDGVRTRFPIYYNDELLSFEKEEGSRVDLTNALLIVINGIVQEPNVAYVFDGGTSFSFVTAPRVEDNIDIFFYRGTRNGDDELVTNINQTIERGDTVQVFKNNSINGTITQDKRLVFDLSYSDKFETNKYLDQGVDEINYKPLAWTKQKIDRVINGDVIYKDRDSIEPMVFPTAKIIDTIGSSDTELFVEDADLFDYDSATDFSGIIVSGAANPVAAAVTATVSVGGTVSGFVITGGSGYTSVPTVSIAAPLEVGVGVGTTATATATISGGAVSGISINNIGFGYTVAPTVMVSIPSPVYENVSGIDIIQGFAGIVTGISTCNAAGLTTHAIKFELHRDTTNYTNLNIGYPIYVYDTRVGSGVTSVASNDLSIVGVGTTFADNVYMIQEISNVGAAGSIICYIDSGTNVVGLASTGSSSDPIGKFSWGRLAGISRSSSPVSIAVTGNIVDVGLTTFPTIQRRGTGLRDTGALPKKT